MDRKEQLEVLKGFRYTHRGYHNKPQIPENSMAAFRRTKERGWGTELDIHLMKDGKLAVIHDSNLQRVSGEDLIIEDLTKEDLESLRLEGTDEKIPMFEELLELKIPLIVELKVYGKNFNELAAASWERLKDYDAPFCVESFDPRAILWYKKNQPQVIRGQLSQNFCKEGEVVLKGIVKYMATDLFFNFMTKPDFVAYNFCDRDNVKLQQYLKAGGQEVSWTLRSKEELLEAESFGSIPIFETFDPDE